MLNHFLGVDQVLLIEGGVRQFNLMIGIINIALADSLVRADLLHDLKFGLSLVFWIR